MKDLVKNTMVFSKKNTMRKLVGLFALSASCLAFASTATYPTEPITLIIPATPGGLSDTVGRMVADELRKALDQTVIVENQTGASGMLAARNLSRAKPDGHTLGIGYTAFLTAPVVGSSGIEYDPVKDFSPITQLADSVAVFIVNSDSPIKSWEMVEQASSNGKGKFSVGIPGYGSSPHFYAKAIADEKELDFNFIPYRGEAPIMTDVLGGVLDMAIVTPLVSKKMIEADRVRPLAISNPKRSPALPDVRTIGEMGLPTLGDASTWIGVFAPANTPDPIVKNLSEILQTMMQKPDVRQKFIKEFGMTPVGSTNIEFAAMLERDYINWKEARDKYQITIEQ